MMKLEILNTDKYCYINAYLPNVEERVGKLGIEYKGDKKAKIIYVITSIHHTNIGVATELINKAIEIFKGYEISLLVRPMPRDKENIKYKTVKGLREFYEKFGFVRTNDPCLPTMILKN